MNTPRYLLVVNPASGRGRARSRAAELAGALNETSSVEVVETRARGDASTLAAEGADRADRVIAVGGDGTLNEVLQGLWSLGRGADDLPALGFLPSGTANAATHALGFEARPESAARWLEASEARLCDVGVVEFASGERPFLLWCGAGYDAVVIETLNASRTGLMGLVGLAYNAPRVAADVFRYDEPPVEVEVDGEGWGAHSGVVIANVSEMGFHATVAKRASPADGLLDVLATPVGVKVRLLGMGISLFTGGLESARGVRSAQAKRLSLRSPDRVPCHVDGEPFGELPIDVRVEPSAIRLLASMGA